MNPEQILDYLSSGGFIGLSILIFYGLARQWWVPGWLYKQEVRDKQEWKAIALQGSKLGERSLSLTELALQRAQESR